MGSLTTSALLWIGRALLYVVQALEPYAVPIMAFIFGTQWKSQYDKIKELKESNDAFKRVAEADAVSRSMPLDAKLLDAKRRGLL